MRDLEFLEVNGFEIHKNRRDNKIVFDPETGQFMTVDEALNVLKKTSPEQYREFEILSRLNGKFIEEIENYYNS